MRDILITVSASVYLISIAAASVSKYSVPALAGMGVATLLLFASLFLEKKEPGEGSGETGTEER